MNTKESAFPSTMRSLRSFLLFASSIVMVGSSVGDAGLMSRVNVVSRTFQPEDADDGFSGTLTINPNLTNEYFKNEVGIDIEKLQRHPELFSTNSIGNYTFPEGSGAEGTLFWNLTGYDGTNSSVAAYEHLTCRECLIICSSTWLIPFGFIM
ncbi:uncharacterized protein F4807DRAFT_146018 [Annulohypoxylon truncatum]|uniref:uncharacterized protein n=1 Tax=Annulohypoxylon truncatum TaxID=327061 RepID=UPI0020081B8C|nr:uncharacterized protein F4807DRAFT_146018 [Annulohypoxylon truncatum]KAI1208678.1 hypothetical protein F4807DRAFT_146018 [Annulohypoxylon truncatum]